MADVASSPAVTHERIERVVIARLNRPERSNALTPDLVDGLRGVLRTAANDPGVHVVVLASTGRSFCAGLDLKHVLSLADTQRRAYLTTVMELFTDVWRLPQPVVASIQGAAVAGGFDLTSFCDLRLASHDAFFAQTEILIGLNAISAPLFHTIGLGHARELAFLGERIDALEAHRIGFVNRVIPAAELAAKTLALATKMAAQPRDALVRTKRLTREMLDQTVDEGLRAAGQSILEGLARPDQQAQLERYVAGFSKKS